VSGASIRPRRPIRRLSRETVERIAAGEVVERPASVVKELVENAYDAGASVISVRTREGGLGHIEVADDGSGIPAEELELAVERHATSKLEPDGPVEEIGSLGFRGEALAAIAAVSRLRIASLPPGAPAAEGLELEGGQLLERFVEARSVGTTVEVGDLFFNTPARRKFVRSPAREQVEVVRTLEQLYLARPSVSLRLNGEGGELLNLPAAGTLVEAASRVFGTDFARGSFAVRDRSEAVDLEGSLGLPALASPVSSGLYLSVNGRPVASRSLAQAVRLGFGETIPRARFPVGVLHLEVPRARLDVNVHPTKREVRFAAPRDVEDAVRRAVRAALDAAPAIGEPSRALLPPAFRPSGPTSSPSVGLSPPRLPRPAAAAVQHRLTPSGEVVPSPVLAAAAGRPRLELLGPVDALYWVAASDDGVVLIDQHAASERLLFAEVLEGGTVARQALVDPVALPLSASERASLVAHAEELRTAGFEVEPFGPSTFRVLSVPTYRGKTVRPGGVIELVRELAEGGRPTVPDGLAERRAASIACHAAIRAGDVVEPATIARVLAALDRLPDRPRSCPHGRPIYVHLPRSRLDRWFLRSGG
jgi:DNA mismatch repair protein MutL